MEGAQLTFVARILIYEGVEGKAYYFYCLNNSLNDSIDVNRHVDASIQQTLYINFPMTFGFMFIAKTLINFHSKFNLSQNVFFDILLG